MKQPDKTAYLIDSSIYVFRAWHVLPDTIQNRAGEPVNALFGFAEFLSQLLTQTDARYIACAFDKSLGVSARNEIYPPYKANRPPAPAELKRQFALCQRLVECFGLSRYDSDLFEADDIIGTLAETARRNGINASVVSADKDLTQFIRDGDEYWNFGKNLKLDASDIKKRFGIEANQVPDMLALCGDKVDNIPGIPGVGERTAARLLYKWGNLDTLFKNTEAVADMKFRGAARVSQLLAEHESTVRLARKLTGLFWVDALPTELSALERRPVDAESLCEFLDEQGFAQSRQQSFLRLLEKTP